MPTPQSQKSDKRPISFVLHDTAAGAAPFEFPMTIRPQELRRVEPARLAVRQTIGGDGGFVDSFGPGVASLQISGHTGWRGGQYEDGQALFQRLHLTVWQEWHASRARAVERGQDPDLVKLIFVDALDDFQWVCAPQQFTLLRSKSQPLLSQFNITLLKLADYVSEQATEVSNGAGQPVNAAAAASQRRAALTSLAASIRSIGRFIDDLGAMAEAELAPIMAPLQEFVGAALLVTKAVLDVGDSAVGLAKTFAKAAMNVTGCIAAVATMPVAIRAKFQYAESAFRNVFCLLSNVVDRRRSYSDYSPFYGSANCSSTWAGGVISPFGQTGVSGLEVLYPAIGRSGAQTPEQSASLRYLAGMDVVLAPLDLAGLGSKMRGANGG